MPYRLRDLLEKNRRWAEGVERERPGFFTSLLAQQEPQYLWIGCADSRVPANEIIGLPPGGVFVHRNIANVVVHTDLNCLSVLQYSVDVLKVKHILVVGHYGCGGVLAALNGTRVGLADNWLQHVRDVIERYRGKLDAEPDAVKRGDLLCEFNAISQAAHVCETTIIRDAWERGQPVKVHAWVYGLKDGLIHETGVSIGSVAEFNQLRRDGLFGEGA